MMLENITNSEERCTITDICDWLQRHHCPLTSLELYYEMSEQEGDMNAYTPLLEFATRSAQITSRKEQPEEHQTHELQEQKTNNNNEEQRHVNKDQMMHMLRSELVQCLRVLHEEVGANGIQEILEKANIVLPLITVEPDKTGKIETDKVQVSALTPQLTPSQHIELVQCEKNIEELNDQHVAELCELRKERDELVQELERTTIHLHSCTSQLTESLQSLTNAIDTTRRELLLPLYRVTALYSTTPSERVLARRQLLHLHKHPTTEIRKSIVKEWLQLVPFAAAAAACPPPSQEATWLFMEREMLPELFHLGNSRLVEQRLLALECVCGLSVQLTLVLNLKNSELCETHESKELKSDNVTSIVADTNGGSNLNACGNANVTEYTGEDLKAVERIYGLLYHGLLRPLSNDTSALVREQVVMCLVALWPSSQAASITYTSTMHENDNMQIDKTARKEKMLKRVLLVETLPRMMEMIVELALDAASGTVRHAAQSQLRSVIFVKSFHSNLLLSSFVPLLLVFVEKEVLELLRLVTSSSVLSYPSALQNSNFNAENVTQSHTLSASNAAPVVIAVDQNAQSVFAHTRPSSLRAMLKGNVYTLIRLVHDALHCAVTQIIRTNKQRLVKVEESNHTFHTNSSETMNYANVTHVLCNEWHEEHKLQELEKKEQPQQVAQEITITTNCHSNNNNNKKNVFDDEENDGTKFNVTLHEINQVYISVVLPSFTRMIENTCTMSTGNTLNEEKTFIDVICRLSYTMALFCKLFDWHSWLQVKKHLLLTAETENKIIEKTHYTLLRMLFAFLLRVVSESVMDDASSIPTWEIEENSLVIVSHGATHETFKTERVHESVSRIAKDAAVCFVHTIASGVASKYTSDECFNVAAEVIAQFASLADHDVKLVRAIKRVLYVMYNFVLYKDICVSECNRMTVEPNRNSSNSSKETESDLASYIESCQLWCIVFIVKVCDLLNREDTHVKSTLFCAFLHHLIDKPTNEVKEEVDRTKECAGEQATMSVKVKEEVICALVQTVLTINDVNEQLALLAPALEMLKVYSVTAHIFERTLHIMLKLISRGITAEAREAIIYPFLEMVMNKLSESSLEWAEMSSTVNELMQVLEAVLRCAVITPSLVSEHLLQPMMEFTSHKLKTVNSTEWANTMAAANAKSNMSSTRITCGRSIGDKWLDLVLRYQGFVERNRENSFVSHFVSSPLFIRIKDELRKRFERMLGHCVSL